VTYEIWWICRAGRVSCWQRFVGITAPRALWRAGLIHIHTEIFFLDRFIIHTCIALNGERERDRERPGERKHERSGSTACVWLPFGCFFLLYICSYGWVCGVRVHVYMCVCVCVCVCVQCQQYHAYTHTLFMSMHSIYCQTNPWLPMQNSSHQDSGDSGMLIIIGVILALAIGAVIFMNQWELFSLMAYFSDRLVESCGIE
jgi:hypothetical protein